ncbi:Cyclic nucleotide-regulated ion channel family protein isoform 1 [Hibiscus syriacus]|uniref:Cyclic nucleotide-regulated ion channel family protein isoform 1 n=1 Tax=Hibiscus syriacus TaxID=106335 RepID=A0A6A3A2S0_HIBSY|nr:Cyclic nucleotide-regulated ion channel family protein isoform 1 [Hibiscus syriacus]
MSYITDRVLAMSFPAERMRAVYRNPLWQVKSVLEMRHQGHCKVYNVCIEEAYDPSHFHGRVEWFPFDDNHVPHFEMMKKFCESVHSWLSKDHKNIAVLAFSTEFARRQRLNRLNAEEALQLYAQMRTTNNEGVSISSQRRYVGYWEKILPFPRGIGNGPPEVNLPQPCSQVLRQIRLYDTVNTNCVFFVVSELQEIPDQMYRPPVEAAKSCCREIKKGSEGNCSPRYFLSYVEGGMQRNGKGLVKGGVRVIFYQKMIGARLFCACFNTAFIKNSLLQFKIRDLDKVGIAGRSICGPAFCVELLFGPANQRLSGSVSSDYDDEVMKLF